VWTVPGFDKELNLVYLPTGNGPPDYWGGDRNEAKEKYGSSVVAVDASTGETNGSSRPFTMMSGTMICRLSRCCSI
jgi:glucose dehydrogenase